MGRPVTKLPVLTPLGPGLYRAKFPDTPGRYAGDCYRVTVEGDRVVAIESWARRRPVPETVTSRLLPKLRMILERSSA